MTAETGCAAVMIGRGAIRNPWIFAQLEALRTGRPAPAPDGAAVIAHLAMVIDRYRETFRVERLVMGKIKELVRYLGRTVADGGRFRTAALRARGADELLGIAETHLGRLRATDLDLDAVGRCRLERSGAVDPGGPPPLG
jgi:tRNA-dihydrouridine synthase B